MTTKAEITDYWTDASRKLFLAEVRVTTDYVREFPRLMIEVPDQGTPLPPILFGLAPDCRRRRIFHLHPIRAFVGPGW
jgi:hypothetical protein